jgi:hypothetical protein
MNKKSFACIVLALSLAVSSAFAEGEFSFSLEFNATVLSADTEGEVESMTGDTGFNTDETKIGVGYESDLWGASASLAFGNEIYRLLSGDVSDFADEPPLALDELYAWVQPFGGMFKFTGGIFENTDGVADYTDDIDNYDMGVFFLGEEPGELTNAALVNGLLSEAAIGPLTLQFLLAPNYSKDGASLFADNLLYGGTPTLNADARFFRFGGRIIVDAGVGTFAALFKTFQWPTAIENAMGENFPGTKENYNTFGAYFDLTAVENLGLSLGYTGFLPVNDGSGVDNILHSGVDLRATWTGIEGLSLSTHNNISFAKGADNDWRGSLVGKDSSFFSLYNAVGGTKELTERFSVNIELANLFSVTDDGTTKDKSEALGVGAKLIAHVGEHAEFNAGVRVDLEKVTGVDAVTTFSIPVGIIVSF